MKPLPSTTVQVAGQDVGTLALTYPAEQGHLFSYYNPCPPEPEVSLTMPVHAGPYDSAGGLPPIFDMHLPEGRLREVLFKMFAATVEDFGDLRMLEIVGQHQLGRVRVGPKPTITGNPLDLAALIAHRGAEDYFDELLQRYATMSGVSGMQPKFLAEAKGRTTERATHHIVKSFDPKEYPDLALNEYFCLRAAHLAQIPAARAVMSESREVLIVDRFDIAADGTYLGLEDFCVLSGMRANGRYTGSYESIAARIRDYVMPADKRAVLHEFFAQLTLSIMVRNGDAHLKNFALMYQSPSSPRRLAPLYDVVCTKVYQPRDILALTLNDDKAYPGHKAFLRFAEKHCMLKPREAGAIIERVALGVIGAATELQHYGDAVPSASMAAQRISKVMLEGVKSLV